jgi:hypothetical protein
MCAGEYFGIGAHRANKGDLLKGDGENSCRWWAAGECAKKKNKKKESKPKVRIIASD